MNDDIVVPADDGEGLPEGPIQGARANALLAAFSKALEYEYDKSVAYVARLRERHPDWSDAEVADAVGAAFVRDMALAGSAAGGLAAFPGAGQIARMVVGITAETAYIIDRTASMILSIGIVYGHDLADFEMRRFTLLHVLGRWAGVADATGVLAKALGASLGKKATKAIPMSTIHAVNRALGGRIIVKWATKTGVVRLGSVIPFGIGAVIGGGGNYVLARGLVKATVADLKRS